jgi:serine/threonine-protein kinase SRPK3
MTICRLTSEYLVTHVTKAPFRDTIIAEIKKIDPRISSNAARMLALLRLGGNRLHSSTHSFNPVLRRTSMMMAPRFIPSRLDAIEDIEDYQPGGYHPISVGDAFDHGHFRVLHKLGFGGSSTVWLARDQRDESRIVTLKAMRADVPLSKVPSEISELVISQKLRASLPPSESVHFQTVDHHFFVQGPNGSHLFLIFPLAGPSILAMSDSPGRAAGSRRLRGDLARKVAKQAAMAMHHMHYTGIVHGGKQSSASFNDVNR